MTKFGVLVESESRTQTFTVDGLEAALKKGLELKQPRNTVTVIDCAGTKHRLEDLQTKLAVAKAAGEM
jgi:hypothetical protein